MTAVGAVPAVSSPQAPPASPLLRDAVLALARIEGARLARHPVVLAGAALSVAFALSFTDAVSIGGDYFMLIGPPLLPLALATLIAANLAALRSRRAGTGELYGAAPAPARTRTLAQLLALAWPAGLAVALVAVGFAGFGAWDGLQITPDGRLATPGPVELAQGPLAVAVLGALGVALARWVPHPAAGAVAGVGLLVFQMPFMMWNLQPAAGWLLPIVNPAQSIRPDSSWPCSTGQSWPCLFDGFAPLGWHLAYLVGVAVLLGVVALLRDGRRRADAPLAAAAVAAVLVAGILQLP